MTSSSPILRNLASALETDWLFRARHHATTPLHSTSPSSPTAIRTRKSSGVISSSPKHTALTVAATKRYIFIAVVATA
ncbi:MULTISPECIES: hypothetical protein [Akkermansia]|uniref:hypothetical protein n=1 Tax=Akkermansia TaxID=239934 RepID=UPI000FE2DD5D|nr:MULTISPECIES: hypothetical protein [Akkermansia]MBT8792534.1 hypothetical protein [Akkermansia muciniphila]MBT9594210.1 hypothetical protein [Akkermansia muciniphila]MDT4467781.1 hypothetical protein [Akkermansia muciniphila]QTE98214.1 hypothetical protein J4027_11285 [Akkermansia muciniphila]QTF00528.1 hypothetical protein J4Z33_11270 [Akkermansia muciniphila]